MKISPVKKMMTRQLVRVLRQKWKEKQCKNTNVKRELMHKVAMSFQTVNCV